MKKEIDKMYEQEPKTWYAKILVALIVAALLAWSMSTVQSGTTGGDGLTVAGKIISGIFHPDTALLFNFTTSGVAYLLLETMCIAFLGTIVEFPIVKDTTPNMMNPRLYTTSYNKPQGQQFDDTAVLSFIKLQYT